MFCRQCGKKIEDDAVFCTYCGFKVKGDVIVKPIRTIPQQSVHASTPPKTQEKKSRRPWLWVLLIVSIFLGLFFITSCFFTVLGINNESVAKSSSTSYSPSKTPKLTSTPKPTETVKPTATPLITLSLGETGKLDDLEVTVKKISFSQYVGNIGSSKKADEGLINCVVEIDIKNNSSSSLSLKTDILNQDKYAFVLIYDSENTYGPSWLIGYDKFFYQNDRIPAKATLKGKILNFQMPIDAQKDKLPIMLRLSYNSIWSGSGEVYWKLR